MTSATQERPAQQSKSPPQTYAEKLKAIMDEGAQVSAIVAGMRDILSAREQALEELLPDYMKGQAKRLIKRAELTFAKSEKLQKCTSASFIKCVLEAAELGFAIDGRLAHAVPYNNTVKVLDERTGKEVEKQQLEAQLQIDYKGLIAHARRLGLIEDCWARVVHQNDVWRFVEKNGVVEYEFQYCTKADTGPVIGAFAVARHKDGWTRLEWMTISELNAIRARSKSWGKGSKEGGNGPWRTDTGEMQKKSAIKRLLKTMTDDPAMIDLLDIDDQDTDLDYVPGVGEDNSGAPAGAPASRAALQQTIASIQSSLPIQRSPVDDNLASQSSDDEGEQDEPTEEDYESAQQSGTSQDQQNDVTHPADTAKAFAQYRSELTKCFSEKECRACYDKWFGPDSTVEFTPEQNQEAVRLRDARIAEIIAFESLSDRMRLLKEKITSYKQPARLATLSQELLADSSYTDEEKSTAEQWIKLRISALQGNLNLG